MIVLKFKSNFSQRGGNVGLGSDRRPKAKEVDLCMSGANRGSSVQVRVELGHSRAHLNPSFAEAGFSPSSSAG